MELARSRSPARTGVVELSKSLSLSGNRQNRLPSDGARLTTPSPVKKTTWRSLPLPKIIGEEQLALSSRLFQAVSPVPLSSATTEAPLPPTLTRTCFPSTRGEQDMPKKRFLAWNFLSVSTCQSLVPLAA